MTHAESRFTGTILALMFAASLSTRALAGLPCDPCDVNCDLLHDQADISAFIAATLDGATPCSPCRGDLDQNGALDGRDIAPLIDCLLAPPPPSGACCIEDAACFLAPESSCAGYWHGPDTACDSDACAFANLTAFRPQHGAAYFPFAQTPVDDADEFDPLCGPGIRINGLAETDPSGEDDLIELLLESTRPQIPLTLRRGNAALRLWTTRAKSPGTEIPFISDRTAALPLPMSGVLTLWIEWADLSHCNADLLLQPADSTFTLDAIRLHTFHGIVIALGGENQSPSVPVDLNHGTFVVGTSLYNQGYDVHMYDEDAVPSGGAGIVYNEVVNAIARRLVSQIAVFGYSHGGGSTYDLTNRLNNNRASIGAFDIVFTSYVDAVENSSDFDVDRELRRPPTSAFHANHYQRGSIVDIGLDGGPVPGSEPPPTGLDVETVPDYAGTTHYTVDDIPFVRDFIVDHLIIQTTP